MRKELPFGYYPEAIECHTGDISITTLPDLEATVQDVEACNGVAKGWIYAPPQGTRDIMSGALKQEPYSARVFGLPKTHRVEHQNPDCDEHLDFLVWTLGFFVGMRLTTTDAGFLDATPLKKSTLHDIVWRGPDVTPKFVNHAEQFWKTHSPNPRIPKGIAAIIHSLFLSQTPTLLMFEEFTYLYIALDGCHAVHCAMQGTNAQTGTHRERVANLCGTFGMTVPQWADPNATGIATSRNETLHEGMFFGEPLGFSVHGGPGANSGNLVLEMRNLACRFLCALLGLPCPSYIRSAVDTRQRHGTAL